MLQSCWMICACRSDGRAARAWPAAGAPPCGWRGRYVTHAAPLGSRCAFTPGVHEGGKALKILHTGDIWQCGRRGQGGSVNSPGPPISRAVQLTQPPDLVGELDGSGGGSGAVRLPRLRSGESHCDRRPSYRRSIM